VELKHYLQKTVVMNCRGSALSLLKEGIHKGYPYGLRSGAEAPPPENSSYEL
jgi:hypothetical protein